MSNTAVRVIVGIIGIPLIIFSAVTGNEVFLVFCTVLAFFCMNEFYNLFEPSESLSGFTRWLGGFSFHKAVFLAISILIVLCFYFEKFSYVLILYFIMFIFLILVEVFKEVKHFEAVGTWLLSVVYISTPFGLLSLMNTTRMLQTFEANYAIVVMVMVWVSDTFAFFGGKLFGKHKLAERISPKKHGKALLQVLFLQLYAG